MKQTVDGYTRHVKTNDNMPQENMPQQPSARRRGKMIAIGGAKGGIGKSLFVANLGVFLSRLGKKTVVVDLDLGGANLHLYMGVWSLTHRIDDFSPKESPPSTISSCPPDTVPCSSAAEAVAWARPTSTFHRN
jgi:Mrp family chromosome partitioning ATPase